MNFFIRVCLAMVLVLAGGPLWPQAKVQTLVPKSAITAGNAFQVQYVVYDLAQFQELQPPDFSADFRVISGPSVYQGVVVLNNVETPVKNFSYTLLPLRTGHMVLKGATAVYKSGTVKSNDASISVTTPPAQNAFINTDSLNEQQLWSQLYVRAEVNKKVCFVGEPLVATFKLYSRLPSSSEVIKNPGFYGFSVVDIPQTAEQEQTIENRGGIMYTTHLLRQVQLYPMQAGRLVIDKMSVNNTVDVMDAGAAFPKQLQALQTSNALAVTVKPLPAAAPANNFTGAVGKFSIDAQLANDTVWQNNTGRLVVTLSGNGNFLQVGPPEIAWPGGVEGFDATVKEKLDHTQVPVAGSRQYEYHFTADSLADYSIPPVSFTYFDPAVQKYQVVTTGALRFKVVPHGTSRQTFLNNKEAAKNNAYGWMVAGLVTAGLLVFLLKRNKKVDTNEKEKVVEAPAFAEQVKAVDAGATGWQPWTALQQVVHAFLQQQYHLQIHSTTTLEQQLQTLRLTPLQTAELLWILTECEVVQYYGAQPSVPFSQLQQRTAALIQQLERE